jgi:quercetin dioxygenase-like cupin family protein
MGKMVDFRNAPFEQVAAGARCAGITGSDGQHMRAEYVRIDAAGRLEATVPTGSDQYFFVLSGEAEIALRGMEGHAMHPGSFGIVQESEAYAVSARGGACEVLSVVAPPPGRGTKLRGFHGGLKVVSMHTEPVDHFPEAKKQRIYLVTRETAGTERAHGMIVKYVPETETTMHMHPDAESLFVFLGGTTRLTVNGKSETGAFGRAAFFGCGDRHDLHGTAGGSHFLEFHIPCGYTTVR